MKIFTLEAIYALHLFNDYSDDLFLLPLPSQEGKSRLENLRLVLEKGYEDLGKMGLIVNDEPTEECAYYGAFLERYHKALYHCQVDSNYFCAQETDNNKWVTTVIKQIDDNQYVIENLHSLIFLAHLKDIHPLLKDIEKKRKNYRYYGWEPFSAFRLQTYYADNESFRLQTFRRKELMKDSLFFEAPSGLYEYDMARELVRSIDGEELRDLIVNDLKVRV
ncbi:hypothetical protein [Streptococcus oricebi]|uniref:Uncharacterized protein n=1 Tax=Streptococcus oricebi TaxID=1547447 RepID=A0ABS5B4S8_9STRE|nr:hypothetical protein [Streptococcus oricebi]MBP2623842.1 hypothetical protein [Streptococcus oricebi]